MPRSLRCFSCRDHRAKTRGWRDDEEVFATIARVGHRAIEKAGIDQDLIAAVGIGAPGPIDFDTGYKDSKKTESPIEFTLTVVSEDLDQLISSPDHTAQMVGSMGMAGSLFSRA